MRYTLLAVLILLAGCTIEDPATVQMTPRSQPQTQAEIAFMSRVFNDIQPISITERREYCGVIGVDASGNYVATKPRRGRASSCLTPHPREVDFRVLASYHTHGAWTPLYLTEVPSFDDMRTDIQDGTDGYIATPGGRLWYIDARNQVSRQICGRGCLIPDPNYTPDPDFPIAQQYTLNDLRAY